MCYYRYHYYSQCAHGELHCYRYCERAVVPIKGPGPVMVEVSDEGAGADVEATNGSNNKARHDNSESGEYRSSGSATPNKGSLMETQRDDTGVINQSPSFTHYHHQPSSSSDRSQAALPHTASTHRSSISITRLEPLSIIEQSAVEPSSTMPTKVRLEMQENPRCITSRNINVGENNPLGTHHARWPAWRRAPSDRI